MQAEIITIGDEILIGQILDSNSKWIATELNKIGVSVYQITSIQDNREQIVRAINLAKEHSDIILITGGLGPTNDDITKLTLTEYFDDTLKMNDEVYEHIRQMFEKYNYPFTKINQDQALVPSKCIALKNFFGTAPGMWFSENGKVLVSMPGVPNEMKGLMTNEVLPRLQEKFHLPTILHKTIMTHGMGESMVAERLIDFEKELPQTIKLAYLPNYGRLRLRLTAKGNDKESLLKQLEDQVKKLTTVIADIVVGLEEDETIELLLKNLLTEKQQTVATAESCTGGTIAHKLTATPGASNYFTGSIVAYSKEIKTQVLGVNADTIEKHSVVSKEVASEMAVQIRGKFNTYYGIATTGNAGPTTDDTDTTVGTVFISIASPNGIICEEFNFGQPREKVIERASQKALEMLKKEILKNK